MFLRLKLILIVILAISFNQEIFCNTKYFKPENYLRRSGNDHDSAICKTQSIDDSIKIERFDHSDTLYDFYYLKLSLFQSDFERLDFYDKASLHGIFIVDKNDFHNDSALFLTALDREKVPVIIKDIYLSVLDANLHTSENTKIEILHKSLFYNMESSSNVSDHQKAPLAEFPCSSADVACSANTYSFMSNTLGEAPASVNGYPNYGCLGSAPAPTWFFMQVGVPGTIIITITQKALITGMPLDVDFICWGPSDNLTEGCATGLTGTCNIPTQPACCNNIECPPNFYPRGNIADCSYSGNATETCTILNAQIGEMYILLLTNFSRQHGTITFSQTGGNGVTNCNIVVFCSMLAITANPTACNMANNTFSVAGNIEFSNPSPTGTLTITDVTASPPIVQSFNPPFISPLAYTLDNIPCDGAVHSLVAVFSDSLSCNLTQTFASPNAGCPSGTISGGGSICNDGISQTTVNINISGPPGPYSFTYAIDGISQPPVTNYSGPLPYSINTKIPGEYTLVSVSTPACTVGGTVSGNATVIVHPLPLPTITGAGAVCTGTTDVTYVTEPFMTGYSWVVSSGGTITAGGNTNSIKVTWNTAGAGSVSVNYTDANGCTAASAFMKNVTVNPLPSPNISGLTSVCVGQTDVTYTTEPSMTGYTWTVTSGGTITAGASTNSIKVTWNTAAPNQSVSVNYTDGNGCTATSPAIRNITVNPLPSPTIIGPASVCDGTTGSTYDTEPFMTGYTWTISSGGTITSGSGTRTIKVNWSSATSNQSVTVNYANSFGCSNSFVYPVTIVPLPVSTFTTSTPSPVCQDSPNPSLYTVDPGGVAATYLWQVTPPALAVIADATANPASITWKLSGSSAQTAQLSLTATTAGTTPVCVSSSSPLSVLINPKAQTALTSCVDPVTSRSAKPFILKGGTPLFTGTPPQGEYLITPATPALYYQNGNYYFDPALVAGSSPASFEITYKYTNQYNCPSITVPVLLNVLGLNPTCGASVIDIRDNDVYLTKLIAGKCWMLENLRYGTKMNAPLQPQTDNCLVEKYCLSSDANCTAYGGLYQWDELIQYEATAGPGYQGVCPPGWHVPSQQEWQDMINAVANVIPGDGMAGGTLKDPYASFNALLNGVYFLNNLWAYTTGSPTATMFWSSTPSGTSHAVARGLNNFNYSVSFSASSRANAFPVRCVKD